MLEAQLNRIEQILLEERARVLRSLERLRAQAEGGGPTAEGEMSAYPLNPADTGTDAAIREQALARAEQESRYFSRIERALERLYASPDTFGRCEGCEREIPMERLEIVPHTRYCLDCKAGVDVGEAA